jgi:hypothetical protein
MIKALAAVAAVVRARGFDLSVSARPEELVLVVYPQDRILYRRWRELQLGQVRSIAPRHIRRLRRVHRSQSHRRRTSRRVSRPLQFATTPASFSTLMSVISRDWARARGWAGFKFTYKYLKSRVRRSQHQHPPREGLNHDRRPARHHSLHRLRADPQLADQDQDQFALMPYVGRSFGNLYIDAVEVWRFSTRAPKSSMRLASQ